MLIRRLPEVVMFVCCRDASAFKPFVTAIFIVSTVALAGARQATDVPKAKAGPPPVVIQGCITGSVISSITTEEQDSVLEIPVGASLRLTGAKDIVRALKTTHNGHIEELTGRIKGAFGPPAQSTTKSFGKLSVGVGGTQGAGGPNAPAVPSMPSFEVLSFRHVGECTPPR